MADFVAVVSPVVFTDPGQLKRLMLLFERMAIDLSQQRLTLVERRALSMGKNDFEFLLHEGLLTTLEGARADQRGNVPEQPRDEAAIADVIGIAGIDRALRIAAGRVGPTARIRGSGLRAMALRLREEQGFDAVAVGDEDAVSIDDAADRDDVIEITLKALPTPSENTPWESITDFKQDPDSVGKHLRLKSWINKVSRLELPIHQLEDELNQLLFEYEEFLRYHSVKTSKSVVQILVTTPATVLEDVTKMKWGKIAKAPFELMKKQVGLYEEERHAAGREVAYIVKAQRRFSNDQSYFS